jgi:hypothetical protein
LIYCKASATAKALFDDPNIHIQKAAAAKGSVWWFIGRVHSSVGMKFPVPPEKMVWYGEPKYSADSASDMRDMRAVQAVCAKANFEHSKLGRLPTEIINHVLGLVMAQEDPRGAGWSSFSWAAPQPRHNPFSGLLQTCRHLNHMVKSSVLGDAVLYFRSPDNIKTFLLTQEMAPMVAQREGYLGTVILIVRDNANWPLRTVVKGITPSLPTINVEWEAKIKVETPVRPYNNRCDRYIARSDKHMMTVDWANVVGSLLQSYGIKHLIVRGNKGLQCALYPSSRLVSTLERYRGCVENVTQIGRWPIRVEEPLVGQMGLAEPGKAKAMALQEQEQAQARCRRLFA